MTADFSADVPAYQATQTVYEAQSWLASGIEQARNREFEQAIVLFSRALSVDNNPAAIAAKSHYHRGCALCSAKRYTQAIADFTQVIQLGEQALLLESDRADIKLAETYIHRGNAYRHLAQYSLALADLNEGVEHSEGSAQSYGCRGLLRLDMDDFEGAIADFNQALTVHPTFAQGYLWRGFAQLRSGEHKFAIADLSRAIEAIPTCAEAYNHRGVAYFYLDSFAAALADFDRAIQLGGEAEAYSNRGNLRQLLGDRAGAVADYDRAIALDPLLAEIYFNRAAAPLDTASGLAEIAADYSVTAGLSVDDAAFYRHRAQVRAAQGHLPAAIADYSSALAIFPTAHAYYQRGAAYLAAGKAEQALEDFDRVIAQSPDYADAYGDRAQLRFEVQDLKGALADADQALALGASQPIQIYATRCLTHFCLAKGELALQDFDQLIGAIMAIGSSQSSSHTSNASTSIGSSGGFGA